MSGVKQVRFADALRGYNANSEKKYQISKKRK